MFDSVSGCFVNSASVGENRVLLSPTLTPWRRKRLKKLRILAARSDLDLWFEDECHFQQHGSRCVMWIPPEETNPVLLHAPTRKGIGVFGAVRSSDGRLITCMEKKFDAMTFLSFLQKLLRHHRHGRKIVVILDNARWHHARLLRPWLKAHQHMIQLIFLPPYSPEMNHAERVWKLTRTLCTHNRYFAELDELIGTVSNQFDAWYKPNDTLWRLCAII